MSSENSSGEEEEKEEEYEEEEERSDHHHHHDKNDRNGSDRGEHNNRRDSHSTRDKYGSSDDDSHSNDDKNVKKPPPEYRHDGSRIAPKREDSSPNPKRRGSPEPNRRGSPEPNRRGSPEPNRRGSPEPKRRNSPGPNRRVNSRERRRSPYRSPRGHSRSPNDQRGRNPRSPRSPEHRGRNRNDQGRQRRPPPPLPRYNPDDRGLKGAGPPLLGNKLQKRLSIKLDGKSIGTSDPERPVPAFKSFHARTSDHFNSGGVVNGADSILDERGSKGAPAPLSLPVKILASVREKFGDPSCRCSSFAYWDTPTLRKRGFKRIVSVEVQAEGVEHRTPVLHSDHVYIYVDCDVPQKYIADVLALSDTITYDRGARVLGARCAGWKTNIATLLLASQIASGRLSLKSVQEKRLLEKISSKAAEDSKKAQEYLDKLEGRERGT